MAIYKLETNKYKVRIYPGHGASPVDKTIEGTLKEAQGYESRERLKYGARPSGGPVPRFSDFCVESYQPHAERHLGAGTWKTRKYTVATLIEFFQGKPLNRFTVDCIEKFHVARQAQGIGNVKINDDVSKLLTILRYAASKGAPVTIPIAESLPEPIKKGRVVVWDLDEIQAIYAAFGSQSPHLLPITLCLINTGMRPGESLVLERSWINFKRRMISIQPNEFWQPKDNEPREVTISDALLEVLKGQTQHPRWVFPTLPTMKSPQGERYQMWPQNQWDAARKLSRVGGSPHICRHTFASHFLQAQPDLFLLAKVLGHSHTRVTALYSHLLPGHLEKSRNAVNIGVKPAALKVIPGGRR